jgi:hypothetical protein
MWIRASGVMPDGRPFTDSDQFKQLLLKDRGKVARAFIEHLAPTRSAVCSQWMTVTTLSRLKKKRRRTNTGSGTSCVRLPCRN